MVSQVVRFRQFMGEVWSELKKTTWPSQKEVLGTTVVVVVTVLICAAYLWVVDLVLKYLINLVLGQ